MKCPYCGYDDMIIISDHLDSWDFPAEFYCDKCLNYYLIGESENYNNYLDNIVKTYEERSA